MIKNIKESPNITELDNPTNSDIIDDTISPEETDDTTSVYNYDDSITEVPYDQDKDSLSNNQESEDDIIEESYDDYDYYESDSDGEVNAGDTFDYEGIEYEWVQQYGDVLHLDFDSWAIWEASPIDNDDDNPETRFFIVDVDTGFIDWDCDTLEEAEEFLLSKEDDYVNDYDLDEATNPSSVGQHKRCSIDQFTEDDIVEESYNEESKVYKNTSTGREYSEDQLKHLFKLKYIHGYDGTFEDWLQSELDNGFIIEDNSNTANFDEDDIVEESYDEIEEPTRNDSSSKGDKKRYINYLISKAKESGDSSYAWKLVDFLYDTDFCNK